MSIINKAFEGAKLQINLSSLVVAAIKHLYPNQDLDTLDVGKTDMIVTEAVESILEEIQEKNLTVLYQTPEKYEVVEKVWEEVFSIVEDPETKRRNTYLGSFLVEELSVELPIAPYTVEYIEQLEDQSDVALGHSSNVVNTELLQQKVQMQSEEEDGMHPTPSYPTNKPLDQEYPGNSNTEITLTDAMLKYYLRGMHKETDND